MKLRRESQAIPYLIPAVALGTGRENISANR